jgi:hypothetical protein
MPERSAFLKVRPPAVAGMFYPDDADALRRQVTGHLSAVTASGRPPKAVVVPHAGFVYSGAVAAAAYAQIRGAAAAIRRVVLVGPSHRVAFRGLALPGVDAFATPLGRVAIDAAGRTLVSRHPLVLIADRPHEFEHSIEVQLPFLQLVLEDFLLLPLVAGNEAPEEVAAVLDLVWGGAETLIVVSTDLSHFHDAATARVLDAATRERILALETGLTGDDACGCVGLNGFLLSARRRGLRPRGLALCNSGDVTGEFSRVVGYGAFAFDEPDNAVG